MKEDIVSVSKNTAASTTQAHGYSFFYEIGKLVIIWDGGLLGEALHEVHINQKWLIVSIGFGRKTANYIVYCSVWLKEIHENKTAIMDALH